ncbi:MAG: PQQ-dependent sugar dehydrogenase, partial [Planctomycetaceae bacterium]
MPAGDAASTDTVLLPNRVLWTTSRVVGFPDPPPPYQVERVYPQLAFLKPLAVGAFPESGLMWVVTHEGGYGGPGRIQCFVDHPDVSTSEILLERPEIIYGAAFHPRFAENGYLFIGCNGQSEFLGKKATRVLRFTLERAPPFRCDPESARLIIEWPSNGHNGGDLTFGPDGMLYVSAGDGTSDSDPKLAGQDVTTLHGAIIRIDVDHPAGGQPYSVPADNPFVETPGARPEIWAYGLRNPWRMTFDRQTGQLWAGDNGQDLRETVHLVRRGQNYGWSVMEGSHPFQLERPRGPTPIVPPTIEHPHSEARSLTGGLVYHGDVLPDLDGAYVYGDYATGNIWGARYEGKVPATAHLLSRTSLQITGFGRNSRGDLLIVDHGGGLYRLIPRRPQPDLPPFPRRLSETGLFTSVRDHEPHPGMIPYSVNSPLWSDGADKQRLIGLPGTEKITFHSGKSWEFPNGTVLVKTFALNTTDEAAPAPATRRIETRLLTKQDNEWFGYSYEWHDDQSDATLVEAPGKDREYHVLDAAAGAALTQKWRFPSRSECMVCHTRAARFILGLNVPQMNKVHRYGVVDANQLEALEHWDVFQNPGSNDDAGSFGNTTPEFTLPQPPEELPRLVNP